MRMSIPVELESNRVDGRTVVEERRTLGIDREFVGTGIGIEPKGNARAAGIRAHLGRAVDYARKAQVAN